MQQYLVAAKLQTDSLIQSKHPDVSETAIEIEKILDDSIKVSRTLAAELSPHILHEAGILAALEWLARWMSNKHGIKIELQMQQMDAPTLDEQVKILLFESVRELLLNVVKHAKTKSAKILLSHEDGNRLQVTVSDDGIGFNTECLSVTGAEPEGFGLFGILERIRLIGGRFDCDSSPGNGARFTLTAPIQISAAPGVPLVMSNAPERPSEKVGNTIRIMLTDDHPVMRQDWLAF